MVIRIHYEVIIYRAAILKGPRIVFFLLIELDLPLNRWVPPTRDYRPQLLSSFAPWAHF